MINKKPVKAGKECNLNQNVCYFFPKHNPVLVLNYRLVSALPGTL